MENLNTIVTSIQQARRYFQSHCESIGLDTKASPCEGAFTGDDGAIYAWQYIGNDNTFVQVIDNDKVLFSFFD